MQIVSNIPKYEKDLTELARLFYKKNSNTESIAIFHTLTNLDNNLLSNTYIIKENDKEVYKHTKVDNSEMQFKLSVIKLLHLGLYETLSKYLKVNMPWGALVGIRPVKMARNLLENGLNNASLINYLQKNYYISKQKSELIQQIIENQKHIIKNDNLVNLYINIPFCPTRCSYCSFISAEVDKCKNLIEPYVKTLIKEIKNTRKLLLAKSLIVKSIYIGGGTPSVLSAEQLDRILKELNFDVAEFTVEAGRVDTLSEEKLDVFKNNNVTRISINPQSFNKKALKAANRPFDLQNFIKIYSLALTKEFIINMDLIAGLKYETLTSFKSGLNNLMEICPANITIHSLSLKRSSKLNEKKTVLTNNNIVAKMLDYAYIKLSENDYKPYYLYRQKNMIENLENVGFSLGDTNCTFNIDSIDEQVSVLACGAGAISKRLFLNENRHERSANVKGIKEYIERIDEMQKRKETLFQ